MDSQGHGTLLLGNGIFFFYSMMKYAHYNFPTKTQPTEAEICLRSLPRVQSVIFETQGLYECSKNLNYILYWLSEDMSLLVD